MYNNQVVLGDQPSNLKEPSDYYHNADFDAACAAILDGIRRWRGFMVLSGQAGLGKSLVLRRCMAEAPEVRFAAIHQTKPDWLDILNVLSASLGLTAAESEDQQSREVRQALADYAERGQTIALLVDDAHQLADGGLRRLRDFVASTATDSGQRLPVVLAGLPELEDKLEQAELEVPIRHRLEPLSALETGLFVSHQLRLAGREEQINLSPAAIERIVEHGRGVPRTIALLCDALLLFADLEAGQEVGPALVDEAARSFLFNDLADSVSPVAKVAAQSSADSSLPLFGEELTVDTALDLNSLALDLDFEIDFDSPLEPSAADPAESDEPPLGALVDPATVPPPTEASLAAPESLAANAPELHKFLQLLEEISAPLERVEPRDAEQFRGFSRWLAGALRRVSLPRLIHWEQRIVRLAAGELSVLVALATTPRLAAGAGGTLSILLVNPSWWQCREIRMRLRSTGLELANQGQARSLRLLDGRRGRAAHLDYRKEVGSLEAATLWLELDVLDHRGLWCAYQSSEIRWAAAPLDADSGASDPGSTETRLEQFWPLAEGGAETAFTMPLELQLDEERTRRLRAAVPAARQNLNLTRGTPLSRALLLGGDASQAPTRIELVARPFFILGRYNPATGAGLGDFSLGFTPGQRHISRLHAVVCALADQWCLMPVTGHGQTYTGRNGQRLADGQWHQLETGDRLDICGLYDLTLELVWDPHREEATPPAWNIAEPRDKFGHYVLDLVERLRRHDQREGNEGNEARLATGLRKRYLNLLRIQDRAARVNGIGNPGALLHARLTRGDGNRQVAHYYVPKWLSLGSAPEVGLPISATDVAPFHADLLYREGIFWIQNLAESGSVQVGCHALENQEVLALEVGDTLSIGAARFEFEAY